jgi:dTDP-4-amino-4,6-dideoxygalactose transaminase
MTDSQVISQASPLASYVERKSEIDLAIQEALSLGKYILGDQEKAFEERFAAYIGSAYAVGTGTGTDALHLALLCCGIGAGDLVLTVSHTAVATAAAIHLAGAVPAFVDVNQDMLTMSPHNLEAGILQLQHKFGGRLKAVIPVHLYGTPADICKIQEICERHKLLLIEDCAQSHGAIAAGKKTGTWGHISAFSFYPTKNLGAIGDGGAIVTNDPELASKAKLLREYGWKERFISMEHGMNTRLDEIQAAILNVKLKYLDLDNRRRKKIASTYKAGLAGLPIRLPECYLGDEPVFHQFVIRTSDRDKLQSFLLQNGIQTAIHYPLPIHQQPAYSKASVDPVHLPVSEQVCKEILSLPMYPQLPENHAQRVIDCIRTWYKKT